MTDPEAFVERLRGGGPRRRKRDEQGTEERRRRQMRDMTGEDSPGPFWKQNRPVKGEP
jgi:hypothetical protein